MGIIGDTAHINNSNFEVPYVINVSRKQIKYLDLLTARKQPTQLSLVVIQIQLYTEHGVKFKMIIYHIA